jgi:F-type H+-transporting ATPase subunit a
VLLFAFCSLGVTALSALDSPVGIPFQVPFIFLALLTSFIQALVFTLLSTIYILLWLPHEEHAHGEH